MMLDGPIAYDVGTFPPCYQNMERILPELRYATRYINNSALPMLLFALAVHHRHAPQTTPLFRDEYDYIVVGAGAAGAAIASRLSEMPCVNVLLLEAGRAPPFLTEVPVLARFFFGTDIDWKYLTSPQNHTGAGLKNRQVSWPSGKALGGSTIWNAMIYVRGNKQNYDEWEKQGAVGWSYDDVLPYFKKMEGNREPDSVETPFHGFNGPVSVETPPYDSLLKEAINLAALEKNIPMVDSNGLQQKGLFNHQATMRNGQRCSTAKAYLVPAEERPNLDIVTDAFVTKILMKGDQVTGVQFHNGGQRFTVSAKKEVILSAGTTNSAQLLMLSGIGPKQHLQKHKINVVADLPVGLNLQDHPAAIMSYQISDEIPPLREKVMSPGGFLSYIVNRNGPLASTEGVNNMMFGSYNGSSSKGNNRPDYQLYFMEADLQILKDQLNIKDEILYQVFGPYVNKTIVWCLSSLLNPKSRGKVTLQSADPYDSPIIDPNYFDDPEDLQDVVKGMKKCNEIMSSRALKRIGARPLATLYPGCIHLKNQAEEYLKCQASSVVMTLNHQVGTAKMGKVSDSTTVVDPELRVKGIKKLRVVDASVMPIVPSGNTMAPTIMVAEKASDIIKKTIRCGKTETEENLNQEQIIQQEFEI